MPPHLHIAEKANRTWPGRDGDDFSPMFAVLKKTGYAGRISLECGWKKQEEELPLAVANIRKQWLGA